MSYSQHAIIDLEIKKASEYSGASFIGDRKLFRKTILAVTYFE
jgi:hypothetical protein